ncbi:phosphoribosylglycinamide formyltransferase [Dyadobacter luteus]|jgi:phosphoribosylglycinamide formyltransferase-1|uniref:Phosphoribosylglycinamide formyltransferase n=1 Tax=Dyadobacter luteus TaxID=2259619 RepID=A0A3D8Y5J4_9BACT|nr:phosphoribosylglycinamide formyltransferase [Dyadobacter luteus]REA57645.1 phosphoribosylglycinamide formyltransferase [Dyadobacter luteus]
MKRIAIFASGSGSNAEKISAYFSDRTDVEVSLILTNNPQAGVIARARKLHIPVLVFDRKTFYESERILEILKNNNIDLIVLAGFMMLIPTYLVNGFENKMVNIHPALLPKYGGKGMYGSFVHEAVVAAKEKESGITIHFVNEHYDEGNIIFQTSCEVLPTDTADDVANKIHVLEHAHFPQVIDQLISQA